MTKKEKIRKKDFPDKVMLWIGSVPSLIVHTFFFAGSFCLSFFHIPMEKILLVVTTVVSLEAIYMAIFIQMAVNRNTQSLEEVEEDIDEIQEDIDEIQEDVDEIQEDVDEIQEDVDEIQEDMDELEKEESESDAKKQQRALEKIEKQLQNLITDIEKLK